MLRVTALFAHDLRRPMPAGVEKRAHLAALRAAHDDRCPATVVVMKSPGSRTSLAWQTKFPHPQKQPLLFQLEHARIGIDSIVDEKLARNAGFGIDTATVTYCLR